jgi:hypothetical protein
MIFRDIGVFNSCIIIATDFLFIILPIPLILSLQLNWRQKISLILTLSVGGFGCVASIVKTVLQYNFLSDVDWTVHDSFQVWFTIEINVGIVAGSLPALKPLLNWLLESKKRFTGGASGSGSGDTDSKGRKRRSAGLWGDRSASRSGYLKQRERITDKEIHMGSLRSKDTDGTDTTKGNGLGYFNADPTGDFEVRISRGEIFAPMKREGTGRAISYDGKHEFGASSRVVSWDNKEIRNFSDDSILPLHGTRDSQNGITKTTEVRLN